MKLPTTIRSILTLSLITVLLLTAGCASTTNPDPYEGYNRKMFAFNMKVDKFVYRPVAKVYDTITPKPLQKGVTNFFANIDTIPKIANDILQLNPSWLAGDSVRLIINTTLGIGGLFDVASHFGLSKHDQDFGLTLARWGFRQSSYFLLPFLPPGTPRDFIGRGVDLSLLSFWAYVKPEWISYAALGLDMTNQRAAYLSSDKLLDEVFDPYIFLRDAYMQKRKQQIYRVLHPRASPEEGMPEEGVGEELTDNSTDNSVTATQSGTQ